jgi:hypothetical protein
MTAFRKRTATPVDRSYMRSSTSSDSFDIEPATRSSTQPELEAREPLLTGMAEPLSYPHGKGVVEATTSFDSIDAIEGQEHLANALPPHESYEGVHRWDPRATWTAKEEAAVVRKTDLYLLSWVCLMVR